MNVTGKWTTQDDLDLIGRAGQCQIRLSDDYELDARVRSLRKVSSLILDNGVEISISAQDEPLSAGDSKGNICRIQAEGYHLHFILGAEVRQKILRKQALGVDESTLQRLVTAWAVFAFFFQGSNTNVSFYFDFSDLAQHSGPCVAFCSNRKDDCLIPDPFFLVDYGYLSMKRKLENPLPWRSRSASLFWRGGTTGLGKFSNTDRYYYLKQLAERAAGLPLDIGFSRITTRAAKTMTQHDKATLENRDLIKDPVEKEAFAKKRYLLDIDGNSNSWGGLYTSLLTGSAVIKCSSRSGFRQWYYDRLQSSHNCFILDSHLENIDQLVELMHDDDIAESIARNGRKLAQSMEMLDELADSKTKFWRWLGKFGS